MKPILFNSEMVRAILDGRKTVTRRVVKPQPIGDMHHVADGTAHGYWMDGNCQPFRPFYRPGDILYVRETWGYRTIDTPGGPSAQRLYKADYPDSLILNVKWHPSIHMPKEAARIFLRVKNARVTRLLDITEEQAEQEGLFRGWKMTERSSAATSARQAFMWIWDSTAPSDYGWADNPWVWVIDFDRIRK